MLDYTEKVVLPSIADQTIDEKTGSIIERAITIGKTTSTQRQKHFRTKNNFDTTAPYDGMAVSLERYWTEFYDKTEHTYEWNNGILEAKPMATLVQVKAYVWFLNLLYDFLYVNPIGEVTTLETAFHFHTPTQRQVRIPDMAIVLDSNSVALDDYDRTYTGVFDICIEYVSDSSQKEIDRDTIIKRGEYALAGVPEYYILDDPNPKEPRPDETAFYRLDANGIYRPIQPVNGVIQSAVLPGFQFRASDIKRRPTPPEMLDDPVYRNFTSPFLRAERIRAEKEIERIERELQAEQERAERELQSERVSHQTQVDEINAYLKAQGISLPDELLKKQ